MRLVDRILNAVTMYRLVVYGLVLLAGAGFWFALDGRLQFTPVEMAASLGIVLSSVFVTDLVLAKIWHVPRNSESWLITALILFLILQPGNSLAANASLVIGGVVASASKYLINWTGKHVFNPAALAAAFLSVTAIDPATWWVGNAALWPFALIVGLAIVRKVRRFSMVLAFAGATVVLQAIMFALDNHLALAAMKNVLIASPLIFLSTIMLTEPATMPVRRRQQVLFAAGIAALYVTAFKIGPLDIYPEVALLIGNIYAFIISPKYRVRMRLTDIQRISDRVYNYVFQPDKEIKFLPGQYMEWTIAGVPFDNRGNRRTFTLASSPTEPTVQLGLKYYDPPSMFKYTFSNLVPGDTVFASQLAGNFTLEGNENKKLVFIAGGIGITPFRSMAKYIVDKRIKCDIVLLYTVADPEEFAYIDVFRQARSFGLRLIPITTKASNHKGVVTAQLDSKLIARAVPDYDNRIFYISGPDSMVRGTKQYLHELGVSTFRIKTDYFSGY